MNASESLLFTFDPSPGQQNFYFVDLECCFKKYRGRGSLVFPIPGPLQFWLICFQLPPL